MPTPTPVSPIQSSGSTPKRVRPKLGKNVLLFGLIIFAIVAAISLGCAYVVAKSGMLPVPYLSKYYSGPKPTRIVQSESLTAKQFEDLIAQRFTAEARSGQRPPYTIQISERELSGVLSSTFIQGLRSQDWTPRETQLAIRSTDLEFFGKLTRGPLTVDLLVRLVPAVQNGVISFRTSYVQIGDYQLSPSLANKVLSIFFSHDFGSWSLNVGSSGVRDVRLSDGAVTVSAAP